MLKFNKRLMICLTAIVILSGCGEKETATIQLQCGNCRRVIYDGPAYVDRNGIKWPIGDWHNCPAWDINCVSRFDSKRDEEHKGYWGNQDGRKDALDFKYHREFDPKIHHPAYVEGYKKGYKEVMDVRNDRADLPK